MREQIILALVESKGSPIDLTAYAPQRKIGRIVGHVRDRLKLMGLHLVHVEGNVYRAEPKRRPY